MYNINTCIGRTKPASKPAASGDYRQSADAGNEVLQEEVVVVAIKSHFASTPPRAVSYTKAERKCASEFCQLLLLQRRTQKFDRQQSFETCGGRRRAEMAIFYAVFGSRTLINMHGAFSMHLFVKKRTYSKKLTAAARRK